MNRPSRPFAALAALALLAQATGAASLPVALLRAPGAFPPPAARFSAFPPARPAAAAKAAPKPNGTSWLESARIVASYLLDQARELPAPPAAPARFEEFARSEPVRLIAATPPAPAEAPANRMLVVMEKGVSVEAVLGRGDDGDFSARPAGAVSRPFPPMPPFREAWIEQGGLRARVSYLNPHGLMKGRPDGYRAVFADGTERRAPAARLDAAHQRTFPIYWHNERVDIELTLENRTGKTLRDVRVEAIQETFRPVGSEGMRVAPPIEVPAIAELAPGARATVRWSARLQSPSYAPVNLEQTHVRVSAGADPAAAPLLDAPQAGVVDPPGPGLMP